MKANIRNQQKSNFSIKKNIYLYNLWYQAALKSSEHSPWSLFSIDISWRYNFSRSTAFRCIQFFCLLLKEWFIFNKNWLYATKNHWMSINVIGRQ